MACAATLAACGQKGPLFLPSSASASGRATLPQTLGISTPDEPGAATAPAQTRTPGNGAQSGARDASGQRAD